MNYRDIREAALRANMMLPELGLVLFTFGNVSAADQAQGVFAIKPSGVPYPALTPEDMVIVDFEGRIVEGRLRPSSDTLTHAVLYQHWPQLGGICHTHSSYGTAWAQALRDIPIMGTTHADHLTEDIPCAPPMDDYRIQGNYERETGYQILDCFRTRGLDPAAAPMVLVGSHAPFAWGATAEKAVYHAAVLEELAKMAYLSLQIDPQAPRLKPALIRKHYERKHGAQAYYGQDT
ncbi:MAG: L-ribulose-5-phosphate 4-epimerase [Bacteroidia bacterium]